MLQVDFQQPTREGWDTAVGRGPERQCRVAVKGVALEVGQDFSV